MKQLQSLQVTDKKLLIREDLNVPVSNGVVSSDARLRAALPTIQWALNNGAKVILMSHLGRPQEGEYDALFSLQPVANRLAELLATEVDLVKNWQQLDRLKSRVTLLENVRFNVGESANDPQLSAQYASLCDIFVMDAFGTAHRAHASTHGVAMQAKVSCAGPLLTAELAALKLALTSPKTPMLAIVGGSKVSTKLTVLQSLSDKVEQLIVGGGIANTFLAAAGFPVGKSLYEADLIPVSKQLMQTCNIPLPVDVVVGKEFSGSATATVKNVEDVAQDDMIFDVGPKTNELFATMIAGCKTLLWNGPVGVFEFEQFSTGTQAMAMAIADSSAFSVAGGGDTLAAIDKFEIADKVSYISTGGGAFLEFVEGKELPAVAALNQVK